MMRKLIAALSLASYLLLSNFCLVSAALAGGGSHGGRRHQPPDSDSCCCLKLRNSPPLLKPAPAVMESARAESAVFSILPNIGHLTKCAAFVRADKSPPGSFIRRAFSFLKSPRAPPHTISL
ncbi:MAG: hypothetical protein ACYCPQ_04830 [Elusimicrobiota bacterium]